MALPISLSYTFATATSPIPLSNLDNNFTTIVTTVNQLGNGAQAFSAITVAGDGSFTGTGQVKLPAGSTLERTGAPLNGMIRYNTTDSTFEGYSVGTWGPLGGGAATGGGPDKIFVLNGNTVTTSYTFPTGYNASTVGPLNIDSGVTVTIPSGSRWVIL